jgi:hypothetical protein
MARMKNQYQIIAKRWFDRKYGNTYHSVKVFKNNQLIGEQPFVYGYGDQYQHTAYNILKKKKAIRVKQGRLSSGMDEGYYNFIQMQRRNRQNFLFNVSDVERKRDLI